MADAAVEASRLAVHGPRGPVFADVSFEAPAGALVAIAGAGGSGRTSLLLALAGRMRPSSGTARVHGHALPGQARAVRRAVAVARATGAVELDDQWTVDDAVALRGVLRRRRVEVTEAAAAFEAAGLAPAPGARVGELAPVERTLLAVALARLDGAPVVVLDDADRGADASAEAVAWRALRRLADDGPTVLATTTDGAAARGHADLVVALGRDGAPS